MIVRPAVESDQIAIEVVHCAAFPTDAEAKLVRQIVDDDEATLSLVAEIDGVIVGHVLFSQMSVVGDGQEIQASGLAPVAVSPSQQNAGIGSALIHEGLQRLTQQGCAICFVFGHPEYYPRFGFHVLTAAPFASPFAGPHFMAVALDKRLRLPELGHAEYASAFSRL